MTRVNSIGNLLAILACAAWVLPSPARGEGPVVRNRPAAEVRDVALGPGGELIGQVLDAQARPLAGQMVSLRRGGHEVVRLQSSAEGRYRATGLSAGVYQVISGRQAMLCRFWTHGAAPPSAVGELLLSDGEAVQRGQQPIENLIFADPVLIGLFVGAAIAVPLAIHQTKEDAPPGS